MPLFGSKLADVVVNYAKAEQLSSELRDIAQYGVASAQDLISEAVEKLNNVKGMKEYVHASVNVSSFDSCFSEIQTTINGIADSVDTKVYAIKEYEAGGSGEVLNETSLKDIVKDGVQTVTENYFLGLGEGVKLFSNFLSGAGDVLTDFGKSLGKGLSAAVDAIGDVAEFYVDSCIEGVKLLGDFGGYVAKGVYEAASDAVKGVEWFAEKAISRENPIVNAVVDTAATVVLGPAYPLMRYTSLGEKVADFVLGRGKEETTEKETTTPTSQTADTREPVERTQSTDIQIPEEQPAETTARKSSSPARSSGGSGGSGGNSGGNSGGGSPVKTETKPISLIEETFPGKITTPQQVKPDYSTNPTPDTKPVQNTTKQPMTQPLQSQKPETSPATSSTVPQMRVETQTPMTQPITTQASIASPNETVTGPENAAASIKDVFNDATEAIDNIISGNKYNKIPISIKPILSSERIASTSVLPIASGVTVASAAGIGAKVYIDHKHKKMEEEGDDQETTEDSGQDIVNVDPSTNIIDPETLEIKETDTIDTSNFINIDKESKEDYYQSSEGSGLIRMSEQPED